MFCFIFSFFKKQDSDCEVRGDLAQPQELVFVTDSAIEAAIVTAEETHYIMVSVNNTGLLEFDHLSIILILQHELLCTKYTFVMGLSRSRLRLRIQIIGSLCPVGWSHHTTFHRFAVWFSQSVGKVDNR